MPTGSSGSCDTDRRLLGRANRPGPMDQTCRSATRVSPRLSTDRRIPSRTVVGSLSIEQCAAAVAQQPPGPAGDENGADDAHGPGPSRSCPDTFRRAAPRWRAVMSGRRRAHGDRLRAGCGRCDGRHGDGRVRAHGHGRGRGRGRERDGGRDEPRHDRVPRPRDRARGFRTSRITTDIPFTIRPMTATMIAPSNAMGAGAIRRVTLSTAM